MFDLLCSYDPTETLFLVSQQSGSLCPVMWINYFMPPLLCCQPVLIEMFIKC